MEDLFSEGATDEDSSHKHWCLNGGGSDGRSEVVVFLGDPTPPAATAGSAPAAATPASTAPAAPSTATAPAAPSIATAPSTAATAATATAPAPTAATISHRNHGPGLGKQLHVQFERQEEAAWSDAKGGWVQCGSPSSNSSSSRFSQTSSRNSSTTTSSSSSSSSSSDEDSSLERFVDPRPPDGGWGWVVVAASFFVHLIADGITYSFGVWFVEFLHYFNESKSKTSWIGSLFMAMPLLSGPVASFLTDRFGCRCVTIVGALMASAGFVVSSFTDSLEMLFLTFGIVAGLGLSLCYVAAVVIVAYYFDRKRSFATGLSVCGSGIGTFLFPPLTQYLMQEYGWRGAVLILAGLLLNLCVCGALMRDLEWTSRSREERARKAKLERGARRRKRRGHRKASSIKSNNGSSADTVPNGTPSFMCDVEQLRKLLRTPGSTAVPLTDGSAVVGPGYSSRMCSSLVNLPTFLKNKEKVPVEVMELLSTNSQLYKILQHNYPSLLASRSFSDSGRLNELQHQTLESHPVGGVFRVTLQPHDEKQELLMKEVKVNGDVARNEIQGTVNCVRSANMKSPLIKPDKAIGNIDEQENKLNLADCRKNGIVNCDAYATNCIMPLYTSLLQENEKTHLNGGEDLRRFSLGAIKDEDISKTSINNNINQANGKIIAIEDANPEGDMIPSIQSPAQNLQVRKLATSYLRDLRVHRHSLTYRGAMLNINRYRLRASSCPDIYRNSMTTIAKEKDEWYAGLWELWDVLVDMFDFSHFRDLRFLLFALSNFLLYTWYDVPYVYLMDNAIGMGYTETDASILVSVIGILNMVGEVALGWMGDRPWVNAGFVYAICMAGCGLVVALIPFFTIYSYKLLCIASGLFGLLIAANYSLTSIILVEFISLERFTNAYGLLLLVQGVANLIGPPLGGWLYDVIGSYDLSFYLAGIFIAISGMLLLILPVSEKYRSMKRKKNLKNPVSVITSSSETCPKFLCQRDI